MKTDPKEKLLREVLGQEEIRRDILQASLRELRNRKRAHAGDAPGEQCRAEFRAARSTFWDRLELPLAIAAAFVLSASLLFLARPNRTEKLAGGPRPSATVVAPAVAGPPVKLEVVTNRGPGMPIVENGVYRSVVVDNGSVRGGMEMLGDSELLALFPDRPAGLIADAHGSVQLVFLDESPRGFEP